MTLSLDILRCKMIHETELFLASMINRRDQPLVRKPVPPSDPAPQHPPVQHIRRTIRVLAVRHCP